MDQEYKKFIRKIWSVKIEHKDKTPLIVSN